MLEDLTGKNNGFFEIICFKGMSKKRADGKRRRLWKAVCSCSKICYLTTYQFNSGKPRSCGCYKQRRRGNKHYHAYHTKHGYANKHPLYRTWKNMKQRCYNPNNQDYYVYGGKGIALCNKWKTCAKTFIEWALAKGWKKGLVIDRINPIRGYCPENCRFITASENSGRIKTRRGSQRPQAILNEKKVVEIKNRIISGDRNYLIAKDFGVNPNVIYQIKTGKTWKHVKT